MSNKEIRLPSSQRSLRPLRLMRNAGGPNCVLLLSRNLYKSPLFLQNEPKFRKSQMNVNKVLTMNYEKYDTWWTGTKRTQTNPNEPKFKIGKMNANSIVTKDYENICPCGAPKNKPKTNPIPQKAKMRLNSILTKDYEDQPPGGSKSNQAVLGRACPACPERSRGDRPVVSNVEPSRRVETYSKKSLDAERFSAKIQPNSHSSSRKRGKWQQGSRIPLALKNGSS